ncbi:putative Cornichon protein [Leishmania utingensis]|uniref:Cornichon protein n=1 Tax=Leishmania utingensis TaxID=653362 RepID=A0AAW3A362_9TRYP
MRFIESQREVIHTLRFPLQHSATDRKRAYMFLLVYVLTIIAFGGNLFHFISGWIAATVLQAVMTILIMIYAFNINDYSDKSMSSMECERACNPLLDAYVALRAVQVVQALVLRSFLCTFLYAVVLIVTLFRIRQQKLYVDAVNLWREVSLYEREGLVFIAIDVMMIIVLLIVMVFSIVTKYSE